VGVGPNTPVVTRIPACAFASAVRANGGSPTYVRINPDPPEGPREYPDESVHFHRVRQPWTALLPLTEAVVARRTAGEAGAPAPPPSTADADPATAALWQQRYRELLLSLHTPRA